MRRLEHLYYKHDDLIARAATKCQQLGDQPEGRQEFINKLAMKVCRFGYDALRTKNTKRNHYLDTRLTTHDLSGISMCVWLFAKDTSLKHYQDTKLNHTPGVPLWR